MKRTLIIPCVTNSIVPVFEHKYCMMNCVRAIECIDIDRHFDEVYFVILKYMDDEYNIKDKISADMKLLRTNAKYDVIILDGMTNSPAETVMKALDIIGIDDRSIFIKDADNLFPHPNVPHGNVVMISSLEEICLVDPTHKSYVMLDEQGFITNAIEKHVISDKFIAGGYSFKNASDFKEAYDSLKCICGRFYISDIVFWLILNKNMKFLPEKVTSFVDFNLDKQ